MLGADALLENRLLYAPPNKGGVLLEDAEINSIQLLAKRVSANDLLKIFPDIQIRLSQLIFLLCRKLVFPAIGKSSPFNSPKIEGSPLTRS
jgi:hypothetical protein